MSNLVESYQKSCLEYLYGEETRLFDITMKSLSYTVDGHLASRFPVPVHIDWGATAQFHA